MIIIILKYYTRITIIIYNIQSGTTGAVCVIFFLCIKPHVTARTQQYTTATVYRRPIYTADITAAHHNNIIK